MTAGRALRALIALLISTAASAALPASAGKPPPPGGASSCSLPPTDLCTDFVLRTARWPAGPIPYYINAKGGPAGSEQAIQQAFLAWQNEVKSPAVEQAYPGDQSDLTFVYMGTTTAASTRDGLNVVHFTACSRCDAGSVQRYDRKGTILEADIWLKANRPWFTDVNCPLHNCGALDVQTVVTHEIGHVIDLYHVDPEAGAALTMSPGASPDNIDKRDLGAGDILGLRKAYPQQ